MATNPMRNGGPHWTPGVIEIKEKQLTVGTASVRAVKNDPMRVGLVVQSSGTGNITLSTSDNPSAGKGIYLAAGGLPVTINDDVLPGLSSKALYAIGDAAGCTLEVIEAIFIEG